MKPVSCLIRFVRDPENRILPDLRHRLPGRGVWVTADRAHLEQAVAKNVFARSFRANVKLGKKLPDQVMALVERRALELLAMANKAGQLVTGFEKIAAEIADGGIAVLIHAQEARPDGCRKLDAKFAALSAPASGAHGRRSGGSGNCKAGASEAGSVEKAGPQIVRLHSSDNLSAVMGKTNVVHAAVKQGGLALNYLQMAQLLERLKPAVAPEGAERREKERQPSGPQ